MTLIRKDMENNMDPLKPMRLKDTHELVTVHCEIRTSLYDKAHLITVARPHYDEPMYLRPNGDVLNLSGRHNGVAVENVPPAAVTLEGFANIYDDGSATFHTSAANAQMRTGAKIYAVKATLTYVPE